MANQQLPLLREGSERRMTRDPDAPIPPRPPAPPAPRKRKPNKPVLLSNYWTVVDRHNPEENWPFLPLFAAFSDAFAYAKEKNDDKWASPRYITSRLMFPNP